MESDMGGSNVWDDNPMDSSANSGNINTASHFSSVDDNKDQTLDDANNSDSKSHEDEIQVNTSSNPYVSYPTSTTNNNFSSSHNGDVWGSSHNEDKALYEDDIHSEVNSKENDNVVDEFKIQNELAQTMKSIMLNVSDHDNDQNDSDNEENNYKTNEQSMYDQTDHVHYEDKNIHRKSDVGNPFLASSVYEDHDPKVNISLLKEKKNELIHSLTKDTVSHGFLKDSLEDKINPDDFFSFSPLKSSNSLNYSNNESPLNNLLNIGGDSGNDDDKNTKSNITNNTSPSTNNQRVVSPNRKVKILRPRRVNKTNLRAEPTSPVIEAPLNNKDNVNNDFASVLDPLSAPTLTKEENDMQYSLSPNTRKQKFIDESEGMLFNIPKNEASDKNQELLSPVSSNSLNTNALSIVDQQSLYPVDEDIVKFDITVGDPLKVGELTNAHVVYSIHTLTKSELLEHEETVVTRRYRDFLWLYHQMLNNHPGYIIPPPPEKQVYGRFDDKFIENRRLSLENMLNKIAQRKVLQNDKDFIIFLQSTNFSEESKDRELIVHHQNEASDTEENSNLQPPSDESMDTMAQILNATASLGITEPSSGGGFFSSLIGLNMPKYVEDDPFILEKQAYTDLLDNQLRQLTSNLDMILEKREDLILSLQEVTTIIQQLSDLEVNVEITDILSNFGELQTKVKGLLEHANLQQILTFGSTIDEYTRVIGSIRNCFENRSKICNSVATIKQHQEKKEHSLAKFKGKNQNQIDKIQKYENELSKINLVLDKQLKFKENFDKIFKNELQKFEFNKVKDFKNVIEIYWESLIENQKLLIELWESFYDKCNFDSKNENNGK